MMAGGDGCMHGCINGRSVNKGGRGCRGGRSASPAMRTKYRQHLGKHRVVWFWLLVCWLLGGLPMQSKYRQHLGKTFGHPFFFTLLPLVSVLVGSACLACCLLGFGENTYGDGWIMDREKNVTFWCVGLLFCLPRLLA